MSGISIDRYVKQLPAANIYLIGGPSGSGKTSFAQKIASLSGALVLSTDHYFFNADQIENVSSEIYGEALLWDSPSSCDFQLLVSNIEELIRNGRTLIPQFNFFENRRTHYASIQRTTDQAIVVEGLHTIRCKNSLTDNLNQTIFSVFVTAREDVRVERIRSRDLLERDRPLSLFEKRLHFIKMAESQWVFEQQFLADLVVDTSDGFV